MPDAAMWLSRLRWSNWHAVGTSPYKIDTAAFMRETRYGVWGCQVTLKPKGYSKRKRTFGKVELQFMDGMEGRFVGLLAYG